MPGVVLEEKKLTVAYRREESELTSLVVADFFFITLPRYAVGRVCNNNIKYIALEWQRCKRIAVFDFGIVAEQGFNLCERI